MFANVIFMPKEQSCLRKFLDSKKNLEFVTFKQSPSMML